MASCSNHTNEDQPHKKEVIDGAQCVEIARIWASWSEASRIIMSGFYDRIDAECNCAKDKIFENVGVCLRTLLDTHIIAMRAIVHEPPMERDEDEDESSQHSQDDE